MRKLTRFKPRWRKKKDAHNVRKRKSKQWNCSLMNWKKLCVWHKRSEERVHKKTIKDYGIDEKDFLDRLDEMSEQAFDDQCTGANPRYPLISEIKDMYLKAYYGKE